MRKFDYAVWRDHMRNNKITQTALAKVWNLSVQSTHKKYNGVVDMKLSEFIDYCNETNADPDIFFTPVGVKTATQNNSNI